MKRFEFSLERVLKLKRHQERLAEVQQLRARHAMEEARNRLVQLNEQLSRVAESFTAHLGQAVAPQQWVTAYEMSDRLGRLIQQAEQEVERAEQALAVASQERAQLATEAEALDTLRQQQLEKWKREVALADQEQLDEVGLRRWQAAQAERNAANAGDRPATIPIRAGAA